MPLRPLQQLTAGFNTKSVAGPSGCWVRFDGSPLEVAQGMTVEISTFPLSFSAMLLAATHVQIPLCLPSGILKPSLLVTSMLVFLRGKVLQRLLPSSSRQTFYAESWTVLMYKNFFNLLRDSIRGNILILLYPLTGSSLLVLFLMSGLINFWWPLFQSYSSFLLAPQGSQGKVLSPSPQVYSSSWSLPLDLWVFCIVPISDFSQ